MIVGTSRCGNRSRVGALTSVARMPAMTRGPLPPRVYWTRRLLLLATAFALVFGFAHWLGSGSDGSSPKAVQADQPTSTRTHQGGKHGTGPSRSRHHGTPVTPHHERTSAPPSPTGPCDDSDVSVVPTVPDPVAGSDVKIKLDLHTLVSPACTWSVSPDTVTLKITSGSDLIWTSQQCPQAIPAQDVVLRRDATRIVTLAWNARRSDTGCPRTTEWALPGYYHLAAAALAGEPHDVQFRLGAPTAPEVTQTVTAHPHDHKHKKKHRVAD